MDDKVVGHVPVCTVGVQTYYGTELEAIAAKLEEGDTVIFKGEREIVDYVWFYEAPIIVLKSGKVVHPELGDVFEIMHPASNL